LSKIGRALNSFAFAEDPSNTHAKSAALVHVKNFIPTPKTNDYKKSIAENIGFCDKSVIVEEEDLPEGKR
jgi:hypothetical protein